MLCGWVVSRVVRSSWNVGYESSCVCISPPLFGPVVVTSWPPRESSLVPIRLVRIGTPVTLTFVVSSPQHCDLDGRIGLLILVNVGVITASVAFYTIGSACCTSTGMSTTLLHELDLWNILHYLTFGHVHVLATESQGYQVNSW